MVKTILNNRKMSFRKALTYSGLVKIRTTTTDRIIIEIILLQQHQHQHQH
ncbi:MAG: hypothetical protein ACXW1A_06150 [Nitrososphaeraceae archaeon]